MNLRDLWLLIIPPLYSNCVNNDHSIDLKSCVVPSVASERCYFTWWQRWDVYAPVATARVLQLQKS